MTTTPSAAEILDRELANTRRQGIVTAAAVAVAMAGAFDLIGALQLWSAVWLTGLYEYVPWALLGLGAALVFLGSRIYSQRLRALLGGIVLVSLSGLATGAWAARTAMGGFLSLLGVLMPLGSLAAAIIAGMAWGPTARTAEARKRAAAAGFDLNL
ncbi:MAG TPA: hypothetical protein VKQ32_11580 [Polyangia bacterium]|nr:hypothetical protein [Polyangia bacterium]